MKRVVGINIISVVAVVIIFIWFFRIEYTDLGFEKNKSPYFGIISMLLLKIGMQLEKRKLKK